MTNTQIQTRKTNYYCWPSICQHSRPTLIMHTSNDKYTNTQIHKYKHAKLTATASHPFANILNSHPALIMQTSNGKYTNTNTATAAQSFGNILNVCATCVYTHLIVHKHTNTNTNTLQPIHLSLHLKGRCVCYHQGEDDWYKVSALSHQNLF